MDSGTILFVDDEPHVRNLGKALLENDGYKVLLARDGIEAVDVFRKAGGSIDLVILDLTMPRQSGQDTFQALRLLDEKVQVVFASGYSSEQLSPEECQLIAGFMTKPYRPRALSALVREVLNRRGQVVLY